MNDQVSHEVPQNHVVVVVSEKAVECKIGVNNAHPENRAKNTKNPTVRYPTLFQSKLVLPEPEERVKKRANIRMDILSNSNKTETEIKKRK